MRYLLDTMVLSEARKSRADERVVAWLETTAEDDLAISVLTLGEIERGVARLVDAAGRDRLRTWLEHDLRPRFGARLLDVDGDVATTWGRISGEASRLGRSVPAIDGLLVATALQHGLTLVTRNTAHTEGLGAEVLDPWRRP